MVKRKAGLSKPRKRQTARERMKRREFVFEMLASPEISGAILVQNMQLVLEWLEDGKVPGGAEVIRVERKSA